MRIAVVGAGGVGGYFGGRLAQANNTVTMVARGEHGNQIKNSGLQIISPLGNYTATNIKVVSTVSELDAPELVLLGVKAWQVKGIAKELKSVVAEDTVIIPLQNGVLAADELIEELPKANVMGGLCNIFSKIESPGIINHMSAEPAITYGELDNRITERAQKIQQLFKDAGIKNKLSEYIQGDIWKKFILICLGGLGALTKANYGVLVSKPALRDLLIQMLNEMFEVSQSEGIKLDRSIIAKTMSVMDSFAPTANSSMARDIWAGRPSELEYQNGTVVKLAKKHKIPVMVTSMVYNCLLPQEEAGKSRKS